VTALARAALAIGRVALGRSTGPRLRAQLASARGYVECPCPDHGRALLEAVNRESAARSPADEAVDQATLLAYRALEARFTADLLPLAAMLVASARTAGLDDADLREAVRVEVAPWALAEARVARELAEKL
jgi:hypothetical protein